MSFSKANLKLKKNFLLLAIVDKLLMYKFFKYKVDKVEVGRKLVGFLTSPPLSIGVTFEIFRISGTTPCCKDWFKI